MPDEMRQELEASYTAVEREVRKSAAEGKASFHESIAETAYREGNRRKVYQLIRRLSWKSRSSAMGVMKDAAGRPLHTELARRNRINESIKQV